MKQTFKEKIKQNQEQLIKLEKKYNNLGTIKLLLFIILIVFLFKSSETFFAYGAFFIFITLILFFMLQYKYRVKINYSKQMIRINQDYIDRINGDFAKFKDDGINFLDKNHKYAYDIDIFGKNSLYQLLNICKTYLGKKKFAYNLLNLNKTYDQIIDLQEATKELSSNIDFCQDYEYFAGNINDSENILDVIDYLKSDKQYLQNKIIVFILSYLPIITAPIFFASIIFKLESLIPVFTILILIQIVIFILFALKSNNYLKELTHYVLKFDGYIDLFKLLENKKFESKKLKQLKEKVFDSKSPIQAFKELTSIDNKINYRSNFLMFLILNVLLLWDIECCLSLYNWRKKYSNYIECWFDAIAEIESIISFSITKNITSTNCYPAIDDSQNQIKAIKLSHPLINQDKRVANDIELIDNIAIVSGSNMSGKTTFLRTIGINLVLSYNGSVVCSHKFTCSILDIMSSMRIVDDLGEGYSTFYCELLKIKNIILASKSNNKILFLIDEIFRGTNSEDRLFGATTVLEVLSKNGTIGLLTTHDLEITKMKSLSHAINYHFKETYLDDKIIFDYKLRKGVSDTTNGAKLMKMVGITV